MSRVRLIVLALAVAVIGGWMVLRPHPKAAAESLPAYGENTEDVAYSRYCDSAPRHWRHVVTRR